MGVTVSWGCWRMYQRSKSKWRTSLATGESESVREMVVVDG